MAATLVVVEVGSPELSGSTLTTSKLATQAGASRSQMFRPTMRLEIIW